MIVFDAIDRTDGGEGPCIVAQPVLDFGMRGGGFFIEFDAESGTLGRIHYAVHKLDILVNHVLPPRHVIKERLVEAVARG